MTIASMSSCSRPASSSALVDRLAHHLGAVHVGRPGVVMRLPDADDGYGPLHVHLRSVPSTQTMFCCRQCPGAACAMPRLRARHGALAGAAARAGGSPRPAACKPVIISGLPHSGPPDGLTTGPSPAPLPTAGRAPRAGSAPRPASTRAELDHVASRALLHARHRERLLRRQRRARAVRQVARADASAARCGDRRPGSTPACRTSSRPCPRRRAPGRSRSRRSAADSPRRSGSTTTRRASAAPSALAGSRSCVSGLLAPAARLRAATSARPASSTPAARHVGARLQRRGRDRIETERRVIERVELQVQHARRARPRSILP